MPQLAERLQTTRAQRRYSAAHKQHHDAAHALALSAKSTETSQRLHRMAEQTRVELLGSNEFEGIGRNLDATLDARYQLLLDTIRKPAVNLGRFR